MPGWLTWIRAKDRLSITASARDPVIEKKLEELKIRRFDKDILQMRIREWRQHFGNKTSRNLRWNVFFPNVIWQVYEQIQAGQIPEFMKKKENIRGLWYHISKYLYEQKTLREDRYGLMGDQLQRMIEAGLISYKDFDFKDSDKDQRHIGTENPYIIVLAEKDGFESILDEVHQTYGCTTIFTAGQGSSLSINYLVADMFDAGVDLTQLFTVIAMVDFDPTGWSIARHFALKLQQFGIKKLRTFHQYKGTYRITVTEKVNDKVVKKILESPYHWLDLIQPKNLPPGTNPREISRPLKNNQVRAPRTYEWAENTGGVDGKGEHKLGILMDSFHKDDILELVDQSLSPFLDVEPGTARRIAQVRELEKALKDLLLYKVLHRPESAPAS